MLQISDSVGSAQNGSITAVVGSGITSMSLAWIGCQPRIDEPSNPSPSSNTASSISLGGTVKCCQIPRKSLNLKSIATAFWSFMNLIASFGVIIPSPRVRSFYGYLGSDEKNSASELGRDQDRKSVV